MDSRAPMSLKNATFRRDNASGVRGQIGHLAPIGDLEVGIIGWPLLPEVTHLEAAAVRGDGTTEAEKPASNAQGVF